MKKTKLIIFLLITGCVFASGQRQIQTDAYQMAISDIQSDVGSISYLDPPKSDDQLAVRLYKQYFNPASFEAYKTFFLSEDWGGFSKADFDKWQAHLRNSKVVLEKTLRVHDEMSQEFIVIQYTVETKEYIMPSTATFKKVQNSWKHISFINDPVAPDLKQIGLIKAEYLLSIPQDETTRSLFQIPPSEKSEVIEKFDRKKLFIGIEASLIEKGVSASDIEVSETLFLEKAEVEMVKFIASTYSLDVYDLMEEFNEVIGFQLYKFINTLKK